MTNQGAQYLNTQKQRFVTAKSLVLGAAVLAQSLVFLTMALMVLSVAAAAKELPNAPSATSESAAFVAESTAPVRPTIRLQETNTVDAKFVSLVLISTGSTFADSYTTLFARQNWLAGKKGVCNVEVQSAYLYGTHPTVGRAYAIASAKSVGSVAAAYYLRKHHSRFWSAPVLANSIISLQGVTQNMSACN